MNDFSVGERPLNDIEAARIRVNLRLFFASEVQLAHDQDESQVLRLDAANGLADALTNPEARNSVAKMLIEQHDPERESLSDLYAYYSLVRRANERHPGTTVPSSLLAFVQELAQNHDETSINFEMTMLLANTDDAVIETGSEQTELSINEATKDISQTLHNVTKEKNANLKYLSETAKELLGSCVGEKHNDDKERLAKLIGNPNTLMQDIVASRFTTPEGLAAAKAQQDSDRLASRHGTPNALLQDIVASRFTTPEGLAAAKAQQDSDRLASLQGSPNTLMQDIVASRFTTPEGLAAAKAQQDSDRLASLQGSPNTLMQDIVASRFTTPEGLAAAKAQQDSDRLASRHGTPNALLQDIVASRFTTPEGLAAAKAQQDSDRLAIYINKPKALRQDLDNNRFLTPDGFAEAKRILGIE